MKGHCLPDDGGIGVFLYCPGLPGSGSGLSADEKFV